MIGRLDRAVARALRHYREEIDPRGRVRIYVGRSHPMAYRSGFVWRSRFVLWLVYGSKRPLRRKDVHHLNRDRSDDRIRNLVPLTRKQHARMHRGKR